MIEFRWRLKACISSKRSDGLALALGELIGFERQWAQKIAGLRTNALVALGAGGFVVFSAVVGEAIRPGWRPRSPPASAFSAPA